MPGTFSKASRPKRPGAYVNFTNEVLSAIVPSQGSVVAVPFTHDWGPFEVPTLVSSFAEFQAVFGDADDTVGYRAVRQAFQGEGVPGRGGAGGVLCFRAGGSAAAKSTKALTNTTPATALTLTARYEGTKGDDLRVTTLTLSGDNELVLYDGAVELERYSYADTDIAALAADINDNSDWVTAVANITGTALTAVTSQAFTGGNDGTTLVAGDWTTGPTAILNALEVERFSVFATPYDIDATVGLLASVLAWAQGLNTAGKRFLTVVGGAAGETVTTANTRSNALSDPDIVNLGVGTYTAEGLAADGGDHTISTAELAPRIGGIIASRGEYQSFTFAPLAGLEVVSGPTEADILTAFDQGTVVLSRGSLAGSAVTRVEKSLTTWAAADAAGDPSKPYLIYRQPKYVRTMHGLQSDLQEFADEQIIGRRPINDATRTAVVAETKRLLAEREQLSVIQGGWTAGIDQDPPPSDDDEFIGIAVGIKFGRALEQVYFSITVA